MMLFLMLLDYVEKKKVVGTVLGCTCGKEFDNEEQWIEHCDTLAENGLPTCGLGTYNKTEAYYECSKCGVRK